MPERVPIIDYRHLYQQFDLPISDRDCGQYCAQHNPNAIPFCCDINYAIPVIYKQEWKYLKKHTDMWQAWRSEDYQKPGLNNFEVSLKTPKNMLLMVCKGVNACQRGYRSFSCRQFPFIPYVTADYRFIGMAYDWNFESQCWLISNLGEVSLAYRQAFVNVFDAIFTHWQGEFDSYGELGEELRMHFKEQKRRLPILHRNGGYYLLSPSSGRIQRIRVGNLPRFGPYR